MEEITLEDFRELDLEDRKNKLVYWSTLYYKGTPEVSDNFFNVALSNYYEDGGDELGIGYGYRPYGDSIEHYVQPVGSLDKCHKDTLEKFFTLSELVEVTPKLDGGSAVAYYSGGFLMCVVSRGNGKKGIDITRNALVSGTIPQTISDKSNVAVRMEVCMSWEDFSDISRGSVNGHPRNKAVGLSQSKDAPVRHLKRLKFIAYNIVSSEMNKSTCIQKLSSWGFLTPKQKVISYSNVVSMLKKEHEEFYSKESDFYKVGGYSIPYDGLVICSENRVKNPDSAGVWQSYIEKSIAYKFEDESAETIVQEIEWNLSKTGRLVPVALLQPIILDGAKISRVTLNNYEWLSVKKCGAGSKVRVVRSNKIIPKIIDVVTESELFRSPTHCPKCKEDLIEDGVDLKCGNPDCGRIFNTVIKEIILFFSPKGVGESMIEEFLKKFKIDTLERLKLFIYNPNSSLNINKSWGKNSSMAKKFNEMLFNITNNDIYLGDILLFSNIDGLGEKYRVKVENDFSVEEFINSVKNRDFNKINKLLNKTAKNGFIKSIKRVEIVLELFEGKIKDKDKIDAKVKFAVTGKLSKPKKKFVSDLEKLGAINTSVVKADVLISNGVSSSSKYRQAEKNGVRIMDEESFMKEFFNLGEEDGTQ